MPEFKYWSLRGRVWALVVLVAVCFLIVGAANIVRTNSISDGIKTAAPVAAVLVGLISVLVTVAGLAVNWRRSKRESSLVAWSEWSDESRKARRNLTTKLGLRALSRDVGWALANGADLPESGHDLKTSDRSEVVKDLAKVLNGLERLAVGVELGIYDFVTLRKCGGTIIVRQWERAEQYVLARRETADPKHRQTAAYVALQNLCDQLILRKLKEDRRSLDQARLDALGTPETMSASTHSQTLRQTPRRAPLHVAPDGSSQECWCGVHMPK